jgi:cullin-associated NEDD8-dissociated protein 1
LVRATVRCIVSLADLAEAGKIITISKYHCWNWPNFSLSLPFLIGNSPKFKEFVDEVQSGPHAEEYRSAALEVSKRESRGGDYMDLSS